MPVTCRYLSRSTGELTRSNRSRWIAKQVWLGRRLYALRVLLSGNGLNSLGPSFPSRCVSICLITIGSSMLRPDVSAMILTAPPHASQVDISILNTRFRRCAFMPSGAGHRGVTTCGYAVICFTAFLAHVALAASCRCHQDTMFAIGTVPAPRRTRHGSVSDWLAVWVSEPPGVQ
jgi:hypothetical protein